MSKIMHLEKDSVKKRLKRIRMEEDESGQRWSRFKGTFAPVLTVETGRARALRMYEPDIADGHKKYRCAPAFVNINLIL